MTKLFLLALTISAFALTSSFADCGGGSCSGGKKKDAKKDGDQKKNELVQVIAI